MAASRFPRHDVNLLLPEMNVAAASLILCWLLKQECYRSSGCCADFVRVKAEAFIAGIGQMSTTGVNQGKPSSTDGVVPSPQDLNET